MQSFLIYLKLKDSSFENVIHNKLSFTPLHQNNTVIHSLCCQSFVYHFHVLFYKTIYIIKLNNTLRLEYTIWEQV